MKTLVIGATGSTGLYLTTHLAVSGHLVVATGRRPRDISYYLSQGIDYVAFDITREEEFAKLPTDVDCVVLLAGLMPARVEGYDPSRYIKINTLGTLNTLEFCRKNGVPKIIFAQSHSDVAGHWNTGELIEDDAPRRLKYTGDHAVYIISKCAAVDLLEHYHQEYGLQTIIFRMPTVYSYWPDDRMYVNGIQKTAAYLILIQKAMRGEPIEIWGDPTIAKDIVYVKDFIQLIDHAMSSETAQGIYNVGTGIATTLEQQIRGIVEVFSESGNRSEITYRPDLPSQTSYLYDVSRARRDLQYEVKYPYMEMLKDMKREMHNPWFSQVFTPGSVGQYEIP